MAFVPRLRQSAIGNWKSGISLLLLLALSGCNVIGVAAQALPPPTIDAQYKGFENQSVGVMVWADRGTRIDWSPIRLDLANSIQSRLKPQAPNPQKKAKAIDEFKGATFPVQPASIVRYQEDHPEIETMQITELAPRFGVTRLIYVEVEEFSTRASGAVDLFRGSAKASVKVIEVDPQTKAAKVAYEEGGITAKYPEKGGDEGVPGVGDNAMYVGTVKALADEVAKRFVPYQGEW